MPTPEPAGILLASGSPQRRAILEQLGLRFRVQPPDVEEIADGDPAQVALVNARRKAVAGASGAGPDELVLAVDTIVVLDGAVHGKPGDVDDARRMLQLLRGRTHHVLGGLVLQDRSGMVRHEIVADTAVTFRNFTDDQLERYLAGGEWHGRAGGYAIQKAGASFVASIDGCYLNVVGLPVAALLDLVDRTGTTLARDDVSS